MNSPQETGHEKNDLIWQFVKIFFFLKYSSNLMKTKLHPENIPT